MKVAIVGSRKCGNADLSTILQALPLGTSEIISGGAKGIDSLAEEAAKQLSLPLQVFTPNYKTLGRQAPLSRNHQIVKACDYLLAFWDGSSAGTAQTLELCIREKKPFRIIKIKKDSDSF